MKIYLIGKPRLGIVLNSLFKTTRHSTHRQIEMLFALCNYIIDNESISKPALVSAPFTNYDRRGFPGVFKMDQINEILSFTEALTA